MGITLGTSALEDRGLSGAAVDQATRLFLDLKAQKIAVRFLALAPHLGQIVGGLLGGLGAMADVGMIPGGGGLDRNAAIVENRQAIADHLGNPAFRHADVAREGRFRHLGGRRIRQCLKERHG